MSIQVPIKIGRKKKVGERIRYTKLREKEMEENHFEGAGSGEGS